MKNKRVTIIDSRVNNLGNIVNACKYLNADVKVTSDIKEIKKSDKIILPGLGAYNSTMNYLVKKKLTDQIYEHCKIKKKYIFGICLGMQLLFESSDENIYSKGLALFKGDCKILKSNKDNFINIPHMGWNEVFLNPDIKKTKLKNLFNKGNNFFYFVHSYFIKFKKQKYISGYSSLGLNKICSLLESENILGTQFHPELSGKKGLSILNYFLEK